MRTLFFEGAGCVPRGDVENCRIRTAFTNDDGDMVYLELSGMEVTQKTDPKFQNFQNVAFVDYCYIHAGSDVIRGFALEDMLYGCRKKGYYLERVNFEYCKQEILNFVNGYLHCSFENIIITDEFDGYRVHKDRGGYNLMDDFDYDPVKAEKARQAFKKIDLQVREQLGAKYSKINLHSIMDDHITVRCYASDESMRTHGLDPNKRFMTVPLDF